MLLAKAATELNIPFQISTVSSETLENIANITEGKAWFQLYTPSNEIIKSDMLDRILKAGYKNLVVTVDIPSFAYRPRDIVNNLSIPPRLNLRNTMSMLSKPEWLIKTLIHGKPRIKNFDKYKNSLDLGNNFESFMNNCCMGETNITNLKMIRDFWPHNLIIKGTLSKIDIQRCVEIGADAIQISNHGARQLDYCVTTDKVLFEVYNEYKNKLEIYVDSGIRQGSDIAVALGLGANMAFLGRTYMYGVTALADKGSIPCNKYVKKGTRTINAAN